MSKPRTRKLIDITDFKVLESARSIEDILCLATLVASRALPPTTSLEEAARYFSQEFNSDCDKCSRQGVCLACRINE